ncbi:helix-turn-helix domain-containing protein [Nocardioides sp. WL0053]|uniref:Helix-turn-helix domain-containing protein n=1 Tax=Nocardioides jiangsuensis TaxID=2866161 RepID=A0ABS7RP89_9ACTN|nr:helix-turn-helix domain-containing protein [Nocardioides jiangsuensis]MBY9076873.1 helix-turn-helix domain-containing protein [Nocardioides jiangsuensis]
MSTPPATPSRGRTRAQIARRLQRSVGSLTTAALARMDRDMPWFRQLSAEDRSWIGLIVQAGINAFVTWYRDPDPDSPLTAEVFGAAPRALTGVVSLHQTVEMVRMSIEVVEDNLLDAVGEEDAPSVREAVIRYAREVAFATAEVYAKAAEMRGAWDARLEALVVDSVLRAEADETVRSRASALGWQAKGDVTVVLGRVPGTGGANAAGDRESIIDDVRRSARHIGLDALCAVQGDRLVVVLGGVDNPDKAGAAVVEHFGEGPVVVGPVVSDLVQANISARAAVAGLRAAPGWPDAPRPVTSDDLLPERALSGDGHARRQLVTTVYRPLLEAGSSILETVASFLEHGGSIEATSRAMYIHANTVRYRLRRAADITGLSASDPRHAYTYRVALTLGRLSPPEPSPVATL